MKTSKTCLSLIVAAYVLTSCSGGDSGTEANQVSTPTTAASSSAPNTIGALEISGAMPVLDRSQSIAGSDINTNGIRDDIDDFIAKQSYTSKQRQSIQQVAKSLAAILLIDTTNQVALKDTDSNLQKAINCVFDQFQTSQLAAHAISNIEKITANTKVRTETYIKYQIAMNGKVLATPQGNTCE